MKAVSDGVIRLLIGAVALMLLIVAPSTADAATSSFTLGDQAVVQVWAGAESDVQIRGSDHPNIEVETDDENVQIGRRPTEFGTVQNPLTVTIPPVQVRVRDAAGNVSTETMAPEDFPYASDFRPGVHDTVRIVVAPGSHVAVTLPISTAILDARLRGAGILAVSDYRGGTLFVGSGGGRTTLTGVGGAAYVQVLNGRLAILDSTFARVRVRGNTTSVVFERVRAKDIEVTTISGAIIDDNGTFEPGLARFESQSGSIAIGVNGGAQIAARSTDGRVLGLWDRRTPIDQRSENEARATVGGGGPVVNAIAGRGNIFIYDGSLGARSALPEGWRALSALLRPGERTFPLRRLQESAPARPR